MDSLNWFQISQEFGFLTPLADLHIKSEETDDADENSVTVTLKNMGPAAVVGDVDHPDAKRHWQVQKVCSHPIKCMGNFLFEQVSTFFVFVSDETFWTKLEKWTIIHMNKLRRACVLA
jgi:hypothetical protein